MPVGAELEAKRADRLAVASIRSLEDEEYRQMIRIAVSPRARPRYGIAFAVYEEFRRYRRECGEAKPGLVEEAGA